MNAVMANQESFLIRFKEVDSPIGISSETFDKLCESMGMSKTAVCHHALMELAKKFNTEKITD